MTVVRAKLEHLVEVRALLRHGRRAYTDFGLEDLPEMLARGAAVVGLAQNRIWGIACAQVEKRPATLPPGAPTRAYLRCIAVHHQQAAAPGVAELVQGLVAEIDAISDTPHLLVSYGMHDWLCHGLSRSGFDLLDTVEFFHLGRLRARLEQRPPLPRGLHLQVAEPDILPHLAELDATAFPPLWHFGERDLVELSIRGRVQVAYLTPEFAAPPVSESAQNQDTLHPPAAILQPSEPVGYAAIAYNSREEAQLARLAVAPAHQGRGIGRALVWDAVAEVVAGKRRTLVLNTQRNNQRSRKLYTSMGFREMGEALPVLGRLIG